MKAIFDHSQDEAKGIKTFFFKPERPVHYTAGQFTELTLPHPNADERGIKRWFTLSSSPTEELLTITTKHAAEHGSTFKEALFALEPGTEVNLADPMGDFVLPKDASIPLVFVAGGIGLTPFHSMMQWLAATGEKRSIKFLYGVNTEDEIIFQNTMRDAGIDPVIVVSNPSNAWGGETGRISVEMILGVAQPSPEALIYVSGPEPMVEALEKSLHEAGIKKDRLVLDFFPGYQNTYSV